MRLSERNGDLGKGILEIYKVSLKKWVPACVSNWNPNLSPTTVCSLLGYNSVNSTRITMRHTNQTLTPPTSAKDTNTIARMYQRKKTNLIKEFGSCNSNENHPVIDLTCSHYGECDNTKKRLTASEIVLDKSKILSYLMNFHTIPYLRISHVVSSSS